MPRQYTPRVACTCEICGTVFYRPPHVAARAIHHYCSMECNKKRTGPLATRWHEGPATLECQQCGKSFTVRAYRKETARFCSRVCQSAHLATIVGEHHPSYKGGKAIEGGYIWVSLPTGGRRLEHHLVMEEKLGHPIPPKMHVHHIDGKRLNNDPANLMLVTPSEHATIHFTGKRIHRWSRDYLRCVECGETKYRHQARGVCSHCYLARYRVEQPRSAGA